MSVILRERRGCARGQCQYMCVRQTQKAGAYTAYLGKYGSDQVAECVRDTLKQIGIDDSHSRCHEGENSLPW